MLDTKDVCWTVAVGFAGGWTGRLAVVESESITCFKRERRWLSCCVDFLERRVMVLPCGCCELFSLDGCGMCFSAR